MIRVPKLDGFKMESRIKRENIMENIQRPQQLHILLYELYYILFHQTLITANYVEAFNRR